ncbi:uncharacterized protein NPIL_351351 [Nephila pilipes]|uniref:Uncharacterized protein n=1 Tax=Nephila pilipes TaxID=299642 RepID=A0A8X6NEN8_NEPPI|nr:uncharacterized protein NPIL_351351 [Nephila pilipes]
MACSRKIFSLEESASARVAMNLCQDKKFKEIALRFEKPTYGTFVHDQATAPFSNDPDILFKVDNYLRHDFRKFCKVNDKQEVEEWDAAIDKQCQRLTKGFPRILKMEVQAWMNRIALEYLSYCRRLELFFGVSRYFLMDALTVECWTKAGRLDEKKLAERFLKDERLTVMQRYRMACVYCVHAPIPQLWNELTEGEQRLILSNDPNSSQESHGVVLLWSNQLGEVTPHTKYQWSEEAMLIMLNGSRTPPMSCLEGFEEPMQQDILLDMALHSHHRWQISHRKVQTYEDWKKILILNRFPRTRYAKCVECFNLPSYYSELMCFFLSRMDEEHQLQFFKQAFRSCYRNCILECYLDWPHQDDFIPTVSRLWGIIPKNMFAKCLLTLASKYTESCCKEGLASLDKEIRYYDYRNMLQTLWEETPDDYKRYLYPDEDADFLGIFNGKMLLLQLLKKFPFRRKDEALFKQIFCYQSDEKRTALMRSTAGHNICALLMQKDHWPLVNWLLEGCFRKEEIPCYKKQFIQSDCGRMLCLNKLKENCERWVEDLIDWCLYVDKERTEYKFELIKSGWRYYLNSFPFLRDSYIRKKVLKKGSFLWKVNATPKMAAPKKLM